MREREFMGERVVVTVLGKDKTGIVAGVSGALAELNVNIEDLASAKMQDMFVMLILADISKAREPLQELQKKLEEKGKKIGVQVLVQHEDIFRYMHRV